MVKYHKKVNKESPIGSIFLVFFILSFALIIPYYSTFAADQFDRPVIDDGGNAGGSSISKQAEKKRSEIIRDILLDLFSFGENTGNNINTPNGTNPTTIPVSPGSPNPSSPTSQPTAGYTPVLPATTGLTQLADQIVSTVRAKCIDSKMGVGSISIRNESCINSLIGIIKDRK